MTQITSGTGELPVLNFANQQQYCSIFPGTDLVKCPQIAKDIHVCQKKYGKKILLSIGGSTYSEGGFRTPDAAKSAANMIWQMFGPPHPVASGTSRRRAATAYPRPFRRAVLDGFDLDFESHVENSVAFASELRRLMDAENSKEYYLTAAPQCVYPDAADNSMFTAGISFDALFVQFYNNPCGLQSFVPAAAAKPTRLANSTSASQSNFTAPPYETVQYRAVNQTHALNQSRPNAAAQAAFNFAVWDKWARTKSANANVKIFLGVPANTNAAGSGYIPLSSLKDVINYCRSFASFGGVSMWDASQAYANPGFLDGVKDAMAPESFRARLVRRNIDRRWQA